MVQSKFFMNPSSFRDATKTAYNLTRQQCQSHDLFIYTLSDEQKAEKKDLILD